MRLFVGAVSQGEEPLKGRPLLSAATASLAAAEYHCDGLRVVVSSFFCCLRSLDFLRL
jgi:hypothetical protein